MERQLVDAPMPLGVRVLDTLVPCGRGQRIGIFAGSGVGKSTLMSMITRGTTAELNVVALVGERGREVREFIEHDLGPGGPGPLGGGDRHLGHRRRWSGCGPARWPPGSPSTTGTRAPTCC